MRGRLDRHSLKTQTLALLLFVVLAVSGTGFAMVSQVLYNTMEDFDRMAEGELRRMEQELAAKRDGILSIMAALSYSDAVQRNLTDKRSFYEFYSPLGAREDQLQITLCAFSHLDDEILDVYLTDPLGNISGYAVYREQEEINRTIRRSILPEESRVWPVMKVYGQQVFAISRPVGEVTLNANLSLESGRIGTCVFLVKTRFIEQSLASAPPIFNVYVQDQDGNVVAVREGFSAPQEALAVQDGGSPGPLRRLLGSHYMTYAQDVRDTGWTIRIVAESRSAMLAGGGQVLGVVAVWVAIILLIVLLAFSLLGNINHFLHHLTGHMELVSQGNLEVPFRSFPKSEFSRVSHGFNKMLSELLALTRRNQELDQRLYREELERVKSRLLALQSQINPHYLYNTIDCIKNIGVCYDIHEIEDLSGALTHTLRYSMMEDPVVAVREELECTRQYLRIQCIRYENRYRIDYQVEEDTLELPILRLVLQPLVENAMKHGLSRRTADCLLRIHIRREPPFLCLTVEDNGVGMDMSTLDNIYRDDRERASIGLRNIRDRLDLFYGGYGRLEFHSQPGRGTSVTLRLHLDHLARP